MSDIFFSHVEEDARLVTELAAGEMPQAPGDARWYDPSRLNARLAVMRRFA